MKVSTVFVVVFLFVGATLANKNHKDQWREKKEKHQKSLDKKDHFEDVDEYKFSDNKGDYDIGDPTEYKGETKTHKLKHYFGNKKSYKKYKKHSRSKKMKKAHKSLAWLDMRSEADCAFKCKPTEVCISGPVVEKPICVHKKDLKKSMKMFHRYHKKEMKDWRKYQKKWYKNDLKLKEEKYGRKLADKEEMEKHEMYWKKLNKDDLTAIKARKLQKLGKEKSYSDRKFHKKAKPHHNIHPKTKDTGCGAGEMAEMKTRMTGWFHLLHGQDHEARKAHGGSIAKFYKHVSAKKEQRELNGEKCQCMKSAMWQFHKMDTDNDDHLVNKELSMLEENTLEPCMRPYLESCDKDGDKIISSDEWCCCFTNSLPPCYKSLNDIRNSGEAVLYMPRCDKEGYFMLEQCKGGVSDVKMTCWCVDYNGNEYEGTAKEGRAHCHKIAKYGLKQEIPLV